MGTFHLSLRNLLSLLLTIAVSPILAQVYQDEAVTHKCREDLCFSAGNDNFITKSEWITFVERQSSYEIRADSFDNLPIAFQFKWFSTTCRSSTVASCFGEKIPLDDLFQVSDSAFLDFCDDIQTFVNMIVSNSNDSPSSPPNTNHSFANRVPSTQPTISASRPSLMQSFCPTNMPSRFPSYKISSKPSTGSSSYPSETPTHKTSIVSSSAPSTRPSASARPSKSRGPTYSPSKLPSSAPTSRPLQASTTTPSNLPTLSHSSLPSSIPSVVSSSPPTSELSNWPSALPSIAPTSLPSYIKNYLENPAPTSHPSHARSTIPSNLPTLSHSVLPSSIPSAVPSSSPTSDLSDWSSALPSIAPTPLPNSIPSYSPSNLSSTVPTSNIPTIIPSQSPSLLPTTIQQIEIAYSYIVEINTINFNQSSMNEILTNVTHNLVSDAMGFPEVRSRERKLTRGAQRKESGMKILHSQNNQMHQRLRQRDLSDVNDSGILYEIIVRIESFILSCFSGSQEPFMCPFITAFITIHRVDGSIISEDTRQGVILALDEATSSDGMITDMFV